MIVWLDHIIFGNGFGTGSPFCDQRYYWLVDTQGKDRDGKNGRLYIFNGWLGAQLRSFEWRCPLPGTTRVLSGREYRVFNATRGRWPIRWDVSWALVGLSKLPLDEANALLRTVKQELCER